MRKRTIMPYKLQDIAITDGFWQPFQELIMDTVIPYQEKILKDQIPGVEKSHAIENFRIAAGMAQGEFYGMVFQDSDVAKWLEGVAYALSVRPDDKLQRKAEEIIGIIEKAQCEDGYLNTYFTVKEPDKRFTDLLEGHELYCAGHMIEAAVAYYEATGDTRLLKVAERLADYLAEYFLHEAPHGIPGHQEIELGLCRLYEITGKDAYKQLAAHFLDERGKNPAFFAEEAAKRDWQVFGMDPENTLYNQSHQPVREQTEAVGHSVRAVYMYTAMAYMASLQGDRSLYEACQRLWENITQRRMYITGGIGSTGDGEAFTIDYDLPNDSAYTETCAAIGLCFFVRRMLEQSLDGKYADVMERALYNGVISGMEADGKKFFYVNPLEVNPGISGELFGFRHVLPQRPGWYACACCPPNVVRMLMSLGNYLWTETEDSIYAHLYVGQEAKLQKASVTVETNYPWEGKVKFYLHPHTDEAFGLAVRVPGYAKEFCLTVNGEQVGVTVEKGYAVLRRVWKEGDCVQLCFHMPVRRIYANTKVREDTGCVALMRGPLVYCLEGIDNGGDLQELQIPASASFREMQGEGELFGHTVLLRFEGKRFRKSGELYSEEPPVCTAEELTAIPYYLWGNRGLNQMRVWIQESR